MHARVQKWGNSLAVRIPRAFAAETGVRDGSEVEISVEEDRIVVDPVPAPKYRLDTLLRRVSKSNLHAEIGTGRPVGRETM
jgi:antitoxin MazE